MPTRASVLMTPRSKSGLQLACRGMQGHDHTRALTVCSASTGAVECCFDAGCEPESTRKEKERNRVKSQPEATRAVRLSMGIACTRSRSSPRHGQVAAMVLIPGIAVAPPIVPRRHLVQSRKTPEGDAFTRVVVARDHVVGMHDAHRQMRGGLDTGGASLAR